MMVEGLFARQFATPEILPRKFFNLPNYEMVVQLMVNVEKTKGFSGEQVTGKLFPAG